ncbi:uncharacterized protein EI90DRAFT_2299914 [Cantharellus anzutake]|uniref:uncharacterized protein n=1 Tax=Cantharellus anzutake TaxID=1750568 RepID=UPI001905C31D|nr:uncharacterized protein EI90DRAFT_2299914 [Cantharellus anzutake]KAF8339903.1 hypothetical protein EI90DRAFT_2299914 [Cantharellus anzutake]
MVRLSCEHGDFEAWVESGGHQLDEYGAEQPTPNSQTCHIPSETGKPFAVCFTASWMAGYTLSVSLYADGVYVGGRVVRPTTLGQVTRIDSAMDSPLTERPCIFASLRLTDDDTAIRGGPSLEEMGTLRITIQPVVETGRSQFSGSTRSLPGDNPINERSKKAGSHAVKLGEARLIRNPRSLITTVPVMGTVPHEIIFKYAPIDFLQAQEIAPRHVSVTSGQHSTDQVKGEPSSSLGKSGPSTVKVKNESKKRVKEEDPIVISSDDDSPALTTEEQDQLARIKAKARGARSSKKPKLENSSQVVVLSD